MAYKITIKYTEIGNKEPNVNTAQPICRCFYPGNCAADNAAFEGSYYDTNVSGWGEGTKLEEFIQQSVAHPGLIAAIKQAVSNGQYVMKEASEQSALYMSEVAPALKDQGFDITVESVEG